MKIPDTITEAEFLQIIKKVRQKHHKLAFMLGFYEGLRVSEVVKLKPTDIDLGRRTIHIRQSKGNKDRIIPISPKVLRGLKFLPIKCGKRALEIAIKKYGKLALNKDIHFHTLRHSCATYYLNQKGWNIRQVQVLLGHSRLDTTQIYTHINPTDLISKMWET